MSAKVMAETQRTGSVLKGKKTWALGMVSQVWGWREKEWRKEGGRWDREVGEALDKVPLKPGKETLKQQQQLQLLEVSKKKVKNKT